MSTSSNTGDVIEMQPQQSPPASSGQDQQQEAGAAATTPVVSSTATSTSTAAAGGGGGGQATEFTTWVTMITNVVGFGVMTLPTASAQSSLIFGLILMLACTVVTFANLKFIVASAEAAQEFNYGTLVETRLPKWAKHVALFALFLFPFGANCAYLNVVGTITPDVCIEFLGVHRESFFASRTTWVMIAALLFGAVSLRRYLAELFLTSVIGYVTLLFIVIVVIVRYFDGSYVGAGQFVPQNISIAHNGNYQPEIHFFHLSMHTFRSIPLLLFAMSIHNNAPNYYMKLQGRTPRKFDRVLGKAHVLILVTYAITMTFGYLSFGQTLLTSGGDLLDSYDVRDTAMNIGRLVMIVHLACVYPILMLAARRGYNNLFHGPEADLSTQTLYMQTAFLTLVAALTAWLVPDVDVLLQVNGALAGTVIIFVVPSLLFLTVVVPTLKKKNNNNENVENNENNNNAEGNGNNNQQRIQEEIQRQVPGAIVQNQQQQQQQQQEEHGQVDQFPMPYQPPSETPQQEQPNQNNQQQQQQQPKEDNENMEGFFSIFSDFQPGENFAKFSLVLSIFVCVLGMYTTFT